MTSTSIYNGEKQIVIHWRVSKDRGALLIISDNGTVDLSFKEKGSDYADCLTKFRIKDGFPEHVLDKLINIANGR
jgi:hypothetical protein